MPLDLKTPGVPPNMSVGKRTPSFLAMGFRPFFLLSAVFACIGTGLWLYMLMSGKILIGNYLSMTIWHAHEMVFGFTLAVIAGFLLTAARSWTGLETANAPLLVLLLLVWTAGRVSVSNLLSLPHAVIAIASISFPVLLTWVIGRVIFRAKSRRNYGIVAILALLSLLSLTIHLAALQIIPPEYQRSAIYAAVHLLVVLNVVMGGRIIPMFTRNRLGLDSIHSQPTLDRLAIASAVLVAILAALAVTSVGRNLAPVLIAASLASGVLQLLRMRTWGTLAALREPMLAVLHAGYAWIGVGYLLLAFTEIWQPWGSTVSLHALTIGVIGTMTVGMMARVTMGHTGRTIKASKIICAAFVAINFSALARIIAQVLPPQHIKSTWLTSGALFIAAYALFLVFAWRPLTTPRPDGGAG